MDPHSSIWMPCASIAIRLPPIARCSVIFGGSCKTGSTHRRSKPCFEPYSPGKKKASGSHSEDRAMKRLPYEDYQRLIDGGRTLAHDTHGAKVIETNDGRMVKLFRTKRLLSAAQWNPYAKRFARNALRLSSLGFPTIEVVAVCRVREIRRDIAVYRRLEGETLRDVLHDAPAEANDLFPRLADLLARLHRHGILFRSIHFGNVLVMRDGVLGLIDVADMRKRPLGALPLGPRSRNF